VRLVRLFIKPLTELAAVFTVSTYIYVVLAVVCILYSVTQSIFTIWLIFDAISSMNRFASRYGTNNAPKSASRHTPESPTPTSVEPTLLKGLQRSGNKGSPAKKVVATMILRAVILVVALACMVYSTQGSGMQHSYVSQVAVMIGTIYILVACESFRQIQEICRRAVSA
jgi:hypothetical protein